jgi:hypothetical protein
MFILSMRKPFILIALKFIFTVQKMINVVVMQWYYLNMQQVILIVHA